jgi:hypothetical protein
LSIVDLFCAQTGAGNTQVTHKAHPKMAVANVFMEDPLVGAEKEKPDRIGDIVFLSIA